MKWDDVLDDQFELSDSAIGWGINVTSNIKFGSDTLRLLGVFGEGIQNYMNDSPVDVGVVRNPGNTRTPFRGEPVPITGFLAFYDHSWDSEWTTSVGYSAQFNDNTDGQTPEAFRNGFYALAQSPLFAGAEHHVRRGAPVGKRENFPAASRATPRRSSSRSSTTSPPRSADSS